MILPLFLGCGTGNGPLDTDGGTTDALEPRLLESGAYAFCMTPGADARAVRDWCELLESAPADACPGMRISCEQHAWEEGWVGPNGERATHAEDPGAAGCNGGGEETEGFAKPQPPVRAKDDRASGCDPDLSAAAAVGSIVKWLAAIGVALLVLVVIRLIFRYLGFGLEKKVQTQAGSVVTTIEEHPELEDVPDLPSRDLLSAARAALADGQIDVAILLARGASLRSLGDGGRLRLHRAKTDREYVRALKKDAELQLALREVVRAAEDVRWAGRAATSSQAERVLEAAGRILRALALALIMLSPLTADAEETLNRYGPDGDAALFDLLAEEGFSVSWRLSSLGLLDDDTDVLVLDTSGVRPSEDDWTAIRTWVEQGGILIAAGDRIEQFPELGDYAPITGADHLRTDYYDMPIPVLIGGASGGWTGTSWGSPWIVAYSNTESTQIAQIVSIYDGAVLAISDSRLLWNGSFVVPSNVAFVGQALRRGQELGAWFLEEDLHVQLATTTSVGSSGEAGENPLAALASARLLPLVAQVMLMMALAALWRGWPFGPLRDPPAVGRHQFSDHVRALGTRWARLSDSGYALSRYAELWLARRGTSGLEEEALRAGHSQEQARAFVQRIVEASESPGKNRPDDLKTVEELWKITKKP